MKLHSRTRLSGAAWTRHFTIILFLACAFVLPARAFIFTIDPSLSSVALSGNLGASNLQEQGPGSLTTTYSGTIDAIFNASSIQFNSGAAAAANNGSWQPLPGGSSGSAPANYGAQASLGIYGLAFGAGRNLVFDIASGVIALSGTSFDASQLTISPTTGDVDFNSFFGNGSTDLSGAFGFSQGTGDLSVVGQIATLTIPVQITQVLSLVSAGDTTLTLTGNIVATAVIPEGSTFHLMIVGGILLVAALWSKRRLFASSKN